MNAAVAITLGIALLSAFLAAIAFRLSRAPLWRDVRAIWPVGAATALFAALDVAPYLPGATWITAFAARLELATGLLVALAWLRQSATLLDGAPSRWAAWLQPALLAAAAAAQLPSLAVDAARAHAHADPVLGGAWIDLPLTAFGNGLAVLALGAATVVQSRFVRAWSRGHPAGRPLTLAFAGAILTAAADQLVRGDVLPGPHLAGASFVLPVLALAWTLAGRIVEDGRQLHVLRDRLEGLVEERTRELAETHSALVQAEKLAALGQFAAGVAHEVNNPASVVTANLSWLSHALGDGGDPAEAREVLGESLDAMKRINELVRKLLDAGRLADLPPAAGNVPLATAVERAMGELRGGARLDVELVNRVPDDVRVSGSAEVVQRILLNLLSNAVEAIPPGRRGRVEARARVDGSSVHVIVEDDGRGMSVDSLRRAFDPFFTTKPVGRGSGLGLPITRGLVEGIGGQIWLESQPGQGTLAALELQLGRAG
jgi:signal transduction histidine kinase